MSGPGWCCGTDRPQPTRILQARDDALVVLRGSGVLAAPVANLLAAAGVGHIHHRADAVDAMDARHRGSPAARSRSAGRAGTR